MNYTPTTRSRRRRLPCSPGLLIAAPALLVMSMVSGVSALMQDGGHAPISSSGQSLNVPSEHANLGRVYHALPGRDRQIFFKSEAPVENITGQSNRVIGYAVAGPSSRPASLQVGQWLLPVDSIKTGIELRDEHLVGEDWFDAEEHPYIIFNLDRVESPRLTREGDAFRTYEATLVGDMTIKGVTKRMRIPGSSITLLNTSSATENIARGDLMAIRASYDITLSDFGVSHSVIGSRVAETVRVDTALYLSTIPPERQR